MSENIEISGNPQGVGLQVRTPGRCAMGLAIEILKFLDEQSGVFVKNTGWKNGFELEVCAWTPINFGNLVAELQTDGDELQIRRASGPHSEFVVLFEMVSEFISDKIT
jgi:hypothetical protein